MTVANSNTSSHKIKCTKMAGLEGSILCLGNPLLDVSANVDQAFLDQYEVGIVLMFACKQCEPHEGV